MTGVISIGVSGIAGWKVVQRSETRQIAAIEADPVVQRSTTYFKDKIGGISEAADLVKDYRLLNTALSAFGLEDDIANKAFIQKVLESDISDSSSLVNRLSDKRYLRMAEAFGFGGATPAADLGETVGAAFVQREFERRIGEGDENLRLALNARRELEAMVGRDSSDKTLWYEVMGNPPLREVFEGAFGFSDNYAQLDVDRQLEEFMEASERYLGTSSFADLTESGMIDKLIINFMARSQIETGTVQNRYSTALTLLSGG
ncbi:DUF1217 domain-containing protein [Paracoccus sp. 1_MG-2023]|uniref:DUF1217 domain-containing protein n=1 Tax=unclassified Paracoccus (in: a-proteobacteria) TaxID=2688777 RepID=UPI001C089A71|nr:MULTISPECIES: DUF1217 domain-containing protein [unclassified Paracoccus (in: a-proteobacteria)]MBU2956187.1 DUF1217 domain-containing protein [Paracoccus sp. C2R09]MDO6667864.1 DUF1217 domain-containing protein [Paracoccus sp. 1_MG-2023]